jgi:hypothetical protein
MKIKTDVAIATQITKAMFDGTELLPRFCKRVCNTFQGVEIGRPVIMFFPFLLKERRQLEIGDWVIDSPFAVNVLNDDQFRSYNFEIIE